MVQALQTVLPDDIRNSVVTLDDLQKDTRKPHLAFFLPHLSGGGVERRFLRLMEHLCKKGVTMDLVLTELAGERLSSVPEAIRIVDLQSRNHRNQIPKNVGLFSQYLKLVRPAIVHSATDRINVVAALGKFISGVDCRLVIAQVASLDLQEISWFKPTRFLHYIMVRASFPLADAFICPSFGIGAELRSMPFMKKKQISPIHNPILFTFTPDDGAKKKYIRDDLPSIVSAGRLSREKDYPTLLHAFALLLKKMPCRLYILGEGKERKKIEELINALEINDNVEMAGFVSNAIDYMHESDVFVLSSVKEGFGLVIIEALVAGTKVVSTDCKHGPAEILENGKYGRLVPIRDPKALSEAMYAALNDPAPIEQEKEDLEQHIAKFSYDKHAEKYLNALGIQI